MRLWSIHPRYLDRQGLLAVWREGLLARKVLNGKTKGYRNHPQLLRFRQQNNPIQAINAYLFFIRREAVSRGYKFADKCGRRQAGLEIHVASGQLIFELEHLKRKLRERSPGKYAEVSSVKKPEAHPIFSPRKGPVEKWESVKGY
jgi:hypothetical protein